MAPLAMLCAAVLVSSPGAVQTPDRLEVTTDDVKVDRSCTVVFTRPIRDAGQPGVVHVVADGITVICEGELRGSSARDEPADRYEGFGIVVEAARVTLRGARVSGFEVGILAREADGSTLEDCDVSGNYRQRLGSTAAREDPADWLQPHDNDGQEWLRYGAGIWVERSQRVTVRRCRARDGQNGLVLDRVRESLIYDNDFSFLSGWGVAMWRSSRNVVSRNALDFCVRGYSHGVYNRGQDSAGLLMFEQCSGNVIAENSITHGGDGIFAFAGQEALGARELPEGFEHERRGGNDNWFARNDLSYAAAHGLELTFSFGNTVFGNRFVENAICGMWGGYSRDTLVAENLFVRNGEGAYGLERGGIDVEHGQGFVILRNRFEENACGVHLWWDLDPHLEDLPWTRANGFGSGDHALLENQFVRDELAIQLRAAGPVTLSDNVMEGVGKELEADEASPVSNVGAGISWEEPELPVLGDSEPIGARERLAGRARIVLTEWGPYDWEEPYLWLRSTNGGAHVYRALQGEMEELRASNGIAIERSGEDWRLTAIEPGVLPYEVVARIDGKPHRATGLLVAPRWRVRFFPWTTDPRESMDAWRAAADGPDAVTVELPDLALPFGGGGPGDLIEDERLARIGTERFGAVAETDLAFPPGTCTLRTVSDDGIRLWIDGELAIDDWTHHASTTHETVLTVAEHRPVALRIEYFELAGGAHLSCEIVPADR